MTQIMTHEEMAALAAEIRDKRRAHVLYTCGEEGILALTFEVNDSEEGPYDLEVETFFYSAELEEKLKGSRFWAFWMRKVRIHGGLSAEDDPNIRRWPGAFKKDDGEIDRLEQLQIQLMALTLADDLRCDITAIPRTRLSYPFERVPYFVPFSFKEP